MRRASFGWLIYLMMGATIGFAAWPHAIYLAPLSLLLLPVVNRRYVLAPFLLMFGYHLATTNGLIHGTAVFFPYAGVWLGVAFWMLSSLLFAMPYLAYRYLMTRPIFLEDRGMGAVFSTIMTSMVSTVLPPLGVLGWTSPWVGVLPSGIFGILVLVILIYMVGETGKSVVLAFPVAILCFSGYLWAPALDADFSLPQKKYEATLPKGWVGIQTNYGELSNLSYVMASMRLEPKVLEALQSGDRVVLLPEGIAGPWLPGTRAIWKPVLQYTERHPSVTVLLGADVLSGKQQFVDALIRMHAGQETVFPDRIPVPFSMWHPWSRRNNFKMNVFGKPEILKANGVRAGYLICYEQLLVWPEMALLGSKMGVLLAPADVWWAKGTSIPAIQKASVDAWARFFGVPVLRAVNL